MIFVFIFASLVILSFTLPVSALILRRPWLAWPGVACSLPLCLYMAASFQMPYSLIPLAQPLLIALGAQQLARDRRGIALLCFAPYLSVALMVVVRGYILDNW